VFVDDGETLHLPEEIRVLEQQLRANPGTFSWYVHNELRHLYLAISEKTSRMHADIILRHSVMDEYILNTLSDWHLTDSPRDPYGAITVLLDNAELYHFYSHFRAACQLQAGDIYCDRHNRNWQWTYRRVANMQRFSQRRWNRTAQWPDLG
jgi:hypothetical protein